MKTRIAVMAVVVGLSVALGAGDLLAAGRGSGGRGQGTCMNQQGSTNRPAGAQRRDGTFMTTGTTANGSTTRPGYGNGPRDGSCRNGNTATTPATQTTAQ